MGENSSESMVKPRSRLFKISTQMSPPREESKESITLNYSKNKQDRKIQTNLLSQRKQNQRMGSRISFQEKECCRS